MNNDDFEAKTKGDLVMEQIGAVKEAAKVLNSAVDDSADEQEEVSGWIATIAKAVLSLLK